MSILKKILVEKDKSCKSLWFMRQAGRYLPEFRKIRSQNKDFIQLCLNSELSKEITLQPINRFDLDAAIIFSDILLVPYALGQKVTFIKGDGPVLEKFNLDHFMQNDTDLFIEKLSPVYEAIKKTREALDKKKSLISFVGAPWTLVVYMLNLKKDKKGVNLSAITYKDKEIKLIIDKLINFLSIHIQRQINAGSDVVQIFDSWAGFLNEENIKSFCFEPTRKLVEFCKEANIPVICFPKGIKHNYEKFNKIVKPDGLNLDFEIDPIWAKEKLTNVVLQGGLNPKTLLKTEKEVFEEAKRYLDIFRDVPYIFNLGHGLVPETKPEMVKKLVEFYRKY
tara:strand:- start:131 stop:1138 length:1008 start_codon:yes stop_codon:yes gene_type:complete